MSDGLTESPQKPSNQPLVSVIVPTRNEADNIAPLLQRLATATADLSIEVIFVDDSSDHTPNMIHMLAQQVAFPIHVIERPLLSRNGLSGAVIDGIKVARGKWLCVMDADLQHPPEIIPEMLHQAKKTGAQLVVGSRKADLIGPLGLSLRRSAMSRLLTMFSWLLFPGQLRGISDSLTGLFLVQRRAVDVGQLRSDGSKILLELLVRTPKRCVSEVHFDFAERAEGQGKADFREGLNFLHHLLRLRLTARPYFVRFWLIGLSGLLINNAILLVGVEWLTLHYLLAALVATEAAILWNFYWIEKWVFPSQNEGTVQQRLGRYFAINQLFLLFIRLPLLWLLVSTTWVHYVVANLLTIGFVSLMRYVLSKRWVWGRRQTERAHARFYYRIHDLVNISSPVALPDLAYFAVSEPLAQIDVYLRFNPQNDSCTLPGAICYDDGLGQLGFGCAVFQGEKYSEVIISSLLGRSPRILYQAVVEPLLRWTLVRKGYTLVNAAGYALAGQGVILLGDGATTAVLQTVVQKHAELVGEQRVILDKNGRLLSFPQPFVPTLSLVQETETAVWLRFWDRIKLAAWSLVNSNGIRGIVNKLHFLPWATLNAYGQRIWLLPYHSTAKLLPWLRYREQVQLATMIYLDPAKQEGESVTPRQATETLLANSLPSIKKLARWSLRLSQWRGNDLAKVEYELLGRALRGANVQRFYSQNGRLQSQATEPVAKRPFANQPQSAKMVR